MHTDVIIIGGGAAGLTAAVLLGRIARQQKKAISVSVLEKAPRVGKKLLATGNGTCNLTNQTASAQRYHGDTGLAGKALDAFSPADTVAFFTDIGVECRTREDGKVYPYSQQATAVLDALRLEAAAYGVKTVCDCPVTAIRPIKNGFSLITPSGEWETTAVLVAIGGAAAPSLGGSADGYRLLTDLQIPKTPLFPSIVQVRTDTRFVRAVKGIRVDAQIEFLLNGTSVGQETGEVLFTEYGLSGPAVMQISRPVADWERQKKGDMVAVLDLLPEMDKDSLIQRLKKRSRLAGRTMEDLLTGLLNKRVGQTVLRVADVTPLTRSAEELTEREMERVASVIKKWTIPVTGTQGFGGAQVTAGGIQTDAFDKDTLMCRRYPGLFAAGEVLDVDGDCGGFNLQFAFSSAYMAATAIAGWLSPTEE